MSTFNNERNSANGASKIAKFIASALNNSSANEACTALKMAAATMQKEGVNPSDFLQEKGADNGNNAALLSKIEELEEEANEWCKKYLDRGEEIAELQATLEIHRRKPSDRAELTEARALAVKFSKELDAVKAELSAQKRKAFNADSMAATAYQNAIRSRESEIESWKDEAARLNKVLSRTICEYETKLNSYRWVGVGIALLIGVAVRMATW